jgi:hypothetical protein
VTLSCDETSAVRDSEAIAVYQLANQGLLDGCAQTTMPIADAGTWRRRRCIMLKRLAALGMLALATLANLSSRSEAAGWAPFAALMLGGHLAGAFDGGPRHGGGFYRPQADPRRYGGFYRGGGYYRDRGFYGDGGFYRAPYSPRYYGAADVDYSGCGFDGWRGYGNYGGYGGYAGYGGYDYDGYGW